MKLVIIGLRRSGTTIFWQTLRQDPNLLCFNEPFNPLLRDLPIELPNGSRAEMITLFRRDPERFWQRFAPIGRIEELQSSLSDRQRAYLASLVEANSRVCFDTTRCHFKLGALAEEIPDAIVVHLKRHPAAMASSHLIPSGSGGRRATWAVRRLGRVRFWTRPDHFNNWGVEELVGSNTQSLFAHRMRDLGLVPEEVYELPAVGKLLAFWKVCTARVDQDGPRYFGSRFLTVRFEDFCRDPQCVVDEIYGLADEAPPMIDSSQVHPPHPPHDAGSARWDELFRRLDILGSL